MSKKSKTSKKKRSLSTTSSQFDRAYALVEQHMVQGNYEEAVTECERLLSFLPKRAFQRVDVLAQLGTALIMLQDFLRGYGVLSEALELDPVSADLWYNRSGVCRHLSRFGQALKDAERAVALNKDRDLAKQMADNLKFSRELAEKSMAMRGPRFTLDQLIEQESLFHSGADLMEAGKFKEAEEAFRGAIGMGDCLPQPWGNLGICLMMQERYDEAEATLKHALEIDPEYAIAKNNLAALPKTRREGTPKIFGVNEPFRNVKLKQSLTFFKK